jgi:hypothetical protein
MTKENDIPQMDPDFKDFLLGFSDMEPLDEPKVAEPRKLPPTKHIVRPQDEESLARKTRHGSSTLSFSPLQDTAIPASALAAEESEASVEHTPVARPPRRFPYALVLVGIVAILVLIIIVQFIHAPVLGRSQSLESGEEAAGLKDELKMLREEKTEQDDFFSKREQKAVSEKRFLQKGLDALRADLAERDAQLRISMESLEETKNDLVRMRNERDEFFKALKTFNNTEWQLKAELRRLKTLNRDLEEKLKLEAPGKLSSGTGIVQPDKKRSTASVKEAGKPDKPLIPVLEADRAMLDALARWTAAYNSADAGKLLACYSPSNEYRKLWDKEGGDRQKITEKLSKLAEAGKVSLTPGKPIIKKEKAELQVELKFIDKPGLQPRKGTMVLVKTDGRWLILEEGF